MSQEINTMPRMLNLKAGVADERDLSSVMVAAAADGAITIQNSTVIVTKGTAAALTLAAPSTAQDGTKITVVSATAAAHTVTVATAGFNDLGAAGDVATFGGAKGDGLTAIAYNGDWFLTARTNITLA